MPNTFDMKRYMAPEFQASSQPAMEWLPWEQNNDAANMGNIVDQLKMRQQPSGGGMVKGGQMAGAEGKAGMMAGGGAGKGGGMNSL